MKRYIILPKWKHYQNTKNKKNQKLASKITKEKKRINRRRNNYLQNIAKKEKGIYNDYPYKKNKINNNFSKGVKYSSEIKAPIIFNILENIDEVVKFSDKLLELARKYQLLNVSLLNSKNINSITISYFYSLLFYIKNRYRGVRVQGEMPKDKESMELLNKTGFQEKFGFFHTSIRPNNNIFSIKSGVIADPEIASKIIEFINPDIKKSSYLKRQYHNLIFGPMENTAEHAYKNPYNYNKWYITAYKNDNMIRTTIIDNGIGIPGSVKKKIKDIFSKDIDYIVQAFKGIRSSSGKPYRNKGLPFIKNLLLKKVIDKLIVISGRGYLEFKRDDMNNFEIVKKKDLKFKIKGTLIAWEKKL